MQEDIAAQLRFGASAARIVSSFDRPNIAYIVRYVDNLPHEVGHNPNKAHSPNGAQFVIESLHSLVEVFRLAAPTSHTACATSTTCRTRTKAPEPVAEG